MAAQLAVFLFIHLFPHCGFSALFHNYDVLHLQLVQRRHETSPQGGRSPGREMQVELGHVASERKLDEQVVHDEQQLVQMERTLNNKSAAIPLYANIALFAILGAWTRFHLGILYTSVWAFKDSDFLGNSFFLGNVLGCFVMGFMTEYSTSGLEKKLSQNIISGITVGYCGSLTTFSSWMASVGQLLAHGKVSIAFNIVFSGLAVYIGAFQLGTHVWKFILFEEMERQVNVQRFHFLAFSALIFLCLSPVIVIMAIYWEPDYADFLVLIGAPTGALLRYILGKWFNPSPTSVLCLSNSNLRAFTEWLPIGTWIANTVGTIITSCILSFVQSDYLRYYHEANTFFSGALSTVSTLVKELLTNHDHGMNVQKGKIFSCLSAKYVYAVQTFLVNALIAYLILAL